MSDYMYIVYKTTNLVNHKFYIGVHDTNTRDSKYYLGSGIALKRAIKQYGKENFIRETLYEFRTASEAYQKESELVTQEVVDSKDNYNLCCGGLGGTALTEQTKEKMRQAKLGKPNVQKGKKLSESHKKKLSEARRKRVITEETRKKLSASMMGHKSYTKGKKWITNGRENQMIDPPYVVPKDWWFGKTQR